MNKLAIVCLFALLQGCVSSNVIQFSNEELDYSQFETYQLINYKTKDQSQDAQGMMLYQSVEKGIHAEMTERQYKPSRSADLLVRYEIVSTLSPDKNRPVYDQNEFNSYNQNISVPTFFSIPESILLIEIKTKKTKKLVWQASLDMKYQKNKDAEGILSSALKEIFDTYRHQANSNELMGN